jgi:enterochelin esterase family protein
VHEEIFNWKQPSRHLIFQDVNETSLLQASSQNQNNLSALIRIYFGSPKTPIEDAMKTFKLALGLLYTLSCVVLLAQQQPLPPYQILSDNRVTFQIKGPQATKVELRGEWPGGLAGSTTVPMTKDENGIWSVTVGPLPSDTWNYNFIVDGVTMPPAAPGLADMVTGALPPGKIVIPGPFGSDFGPQKVPHGTVSYPHVPFLGLSKVLEVYLPAEYVDNPTKRYPVLYISGYSNEWEHSVNLHFLLDNMIASGRIKPLIAVVLDPNGPESISLGQTPYSGGGAMGGPAFFKGAQAIADEIVPWVDKAYRTTPDRDHRAITGFSSPGSLGFMAGANNPDKFAWIGVFSGGFPTWPDVSVHIESKLDPKKFSGPDLNRVPDMKVLGSEIPKLTPAAKFKLVYLSNGTNEPLIQTEALVKKLLDERGVKYYQADLSDYTHEWRSVRFALRDFLPRIFQ